MTDLSAELAVAPTPDGGAPELRVIAAAAQAAGRQPAAARTGRIDPAANRQEATLVLDGIDVAALLALLDTPDVAATGRLSGTVPDPGRRRHRDDPGRRPRGRGARGAGG